MAIGPLLPWKRAALRPALERIWLAAFVAIIIFLVMALRSNAVTALGLAGGVWVVLSALSDIAERIKLIYARRSGFLWNRLRGTTACGFWRRLWAYWLRRHGFGHCRHDTGLAKSRCAQPRANHRTWGGYEWTLNDLHDAPGPNYTQRVADLTISKNGKPFSDAASFPAFLREPESHHQ